MSRKIEGLAHGVESGGAVQRLEKPRQGSVDRRLCSYFLRPKDLQKTSTKRVDRLQMIARRSNLVAEQIVH